MKQVVKKLTIIAIALLLPAFVWAIPATPHQFYGTVDFENGPAPDGLLVEVKIDNVVVASTVTENGRYGDAVFYVEDPDSNRSGKTLRFYVNGINSEETYIFANWESTELNLTVPGIIGTIEETDEHAVIENKTVAVASGQLANVKLGENLNITISSDVSTNAVIEKIEKKSSDGVAIFSGKNFLNAYEIKITGENLSISVTMKYDDTGIDEDTIAPYHFVNNVWTAITPFTPDKTANTITFNIFSGETIYGLFGSEAQAAPPGGGGPGGAGGGGEPPATYKTGDIDQNNKVDIFDFNILMINWGDNPANPAADLNGDGKVDIFDFNLLMVNWG